MCKRQKPPAVLMFYEETCWGAVGSGVCPSSGARWSVPMEPSASLSPWAALGIPGQRWASLSSAGHPWAMLDIPEQCWASLSSAGHPWAVPDIPGQCWASLGSAGLGTQEQRDRRLLVLWGPADLQLSHISHSKAQLLGSMTAAVRDIQLLSLALKQDICVSLILRFVLFSCLFYFSNKICR